MQGSLPRTPYNRIIHFIRNYNIAGPLTVKPRSFLRRCQARPSTSPDWCHYRNTLSQRRYIQSTHSYPNSLHGTTSMQHEP